MACNKCGHTKSSPCACQDHGLITPCSYSDCTRKAETETCEDIQCAECVLLSRNIFVTQGGNTLGVTEGENLIYTTKICIIYSISSKLGQEYSSFIP